MSQKTGIKTITYNVDNSVTYKGYVSIIRECKRFDLQTLDMSFYNENEEKFLEVVKILESLE